MVHDDWLDISTKYCVVLHRFEDEEDLVLHDLSYEAARIAINVADYMCCEGIRMAKEPYRSIFRS